MLSLIISIISLCLSITLFVINHFKQLYKVGVSTGEVTFDDVITKNGQKRTRMYVELKIVNESLAPFTIVGLAILEEENQQYTSDAGEFIDCNLPIKSDENQIEIGELKGTSTLPIVVPPYSSYHGVVAFYHPTTYRQGKFIEIETPKRFISVPFNPTPDFYIYHEDRHGRGRKLRFYWRQNPIRSLQNKIVLLFGKEYWVKLYNKIKGKILKIFSNLKKKYNKYKR